MSGKNSENAGVHLSEELLRSFVDGDVPGGELIPHLKVCEACRARVKALRAFDAEVKSALSERASFNMSAQVLRRLGVRERESYAFKSVQWLAPAVAFGIVCGVMYFAFRVAGALNAPEEQNSAAMLSGALDSVGKYSSGMSAAFSNWLNAYGSFAFAQSTFGLNAFFVLFLGGVALLDKFLFLPWFRNRRIG
jgi:hypothetical protein